MVQQLTSVRLLIAVALEFEGALVGGARFGGLADCFGGLAEPAPVPASAGRDLGVVAQVAVGLLEAAEVVERVAESEVRHRVAGLEACEPEAERVFALGVDGGAEELAVDRALLAEQRTRSEHDLASGDGAESEHGSVEARAAPDLLYFRV